MKIFLLICMNIFLMIGCLNSQNRLGIAGSYRMGCYVDYSKEEEYISNYSNKSGLGIASFYENSIDSNTLFRIGLSYYFQYSNIDIKTKQLSRDLNFMIHAFEIQMIPLFQVYKNKFTEFYLSFGILASCNLVVHSKGNGWDVIHHTSEDSSGNSYSYFTTEYWERDSKNSSDLKRFNLGGTIGFDIRIPINDRVHFLFQNNYRMYFTRNLADVKLAYTSFLVGDINIGFAYKMKKLK